MLHPASSFSPPPGCPAIAELGTSHKGDLVRARELVDAAADAGAWAVKVQIFYAEEILPKNSGLVPLPGGPVPLYQEFLKIQETTLGRDAPSFYADLQSYAHSRGLVFLGSAFGPHSADKLAELGVPAFKIASPELNYLSLLRHLARYRRPLILSTGVSRLGDIEEALLVIQETQPDLEIVLLHCLTVYPAPLEEANIRVIPFLSNIFGLQVGFSDHSLDPVLLPSLASAMGARMLEKHLTLDKNSGGLDDLVALRPQDFALMTKSLNECAGIGEFEVLARLRSAYPLTLLKTALGDGVKRLAPSEKKNYLRSNRSLHALKDLSPGTRISLENTACLRTEKNLKPGILPRDLPQVMGRRLTQGVSAGEGICWDDFLTL